MIYLDTSVALAHLFGEAQAPPEKLWQEHLVSSRLLEYEIWVRVHARRLADSDGDAVRTLIGVVDLLELSPPVLTRALHSFPVAVRTLDALHLASVDFLRSAGQRVELATYDDRMIVAARSMGIALAEL